MTDKISSLKVGRYGKHIVLEALEGAKTWSADNFEDSKSYDIDWEGRKISVFSSSVLRGTGFSFPNPNRYNPEMINVFIGLDGESCYFWVVKGFNKTIFYGSLKESISIEQLPAKIREVAEGGE